MDKVAIRTELDGAQWAVGDLKGFGLPGIPCVCRIGLQLGVTLHVPGGCSWLVSVQDVHGLVSPLPTSSTSGSSLCGRLPRNTLKCYMGTLRSSLLPLQVTLGLCILPRQPRVRCRDQISGYWGVNLESLCKPHQCFPAGVRACRSLCDLPVFYCTMQHGTVPPHTFPFIMAGV